MPPTRKTSTSRPYPGQPTDVPTDRKVKAQKRVKPIVSEDPDVRYAPQQWGGSNDAGLEDLVCPSGQMCLVRRPGTEGLIKAGILRDLDSLTALVNEEHVKRVKGVPQIDIATLMKDPENITNILHVTDRVVCYVVVKPEVQMAPNSPALRQSGVIYTDMVDLDDKMFILNFAVGGTRDLETFRKERQQLVGSLDSGKAAQK